ncbi:MAG TPA: hypothetical protein VK619_13815 [Pyrinomonadaceae bacterium]|nr:hypothetical protein [Pyrinomonadaceae bacterium]
MTDMNKSKVIKLKVSNDDNVRRRLIWDPPAENEWDPYSIEWGALKRRSEDVRQSLKRFVNKCMTDGPNRTGKELKQLAVEGKRLYELLFKRQRGPEEPKKVKEWLEGLEPGYRIIVTVDEQTYVPWGLVYDADPDKLSGEEEDVDINHYQNFWCFKYCLSTMYYKIGAKNVKSPKSIDSFKILSVTHDETITQVKACLTDEEKRLFDWWYKKDVAPPLKSSAELSAKWKKLADEIDLLYFYCHASGTDLALSDGDTIHRDIIKYDLTRQASLSNKYDCLVFLNGCATAIGDPEGGFLEATSGDGFCGFIGTEAEVPDIFALRFGLAFLYNFFHEGMPVYSIMDKLRRDHWPLSIIYSTNCYPMLQAGKMQPSTLPAMSFGNFSELKLGTTEESLM